MIGEHCWDDCKRLHTQSCTEVTVIRNREGKQPEEVKVQLLLNKANGLGIGKKSNNAKQGDWLDKDAIQEVTSCVKGRYIYTCIERSTCLSIYFVLYISH